MEVRDSRITSICESPEVSRDWHGLKEAMASLVRIAGRTQLERQSMADALADAVAVKLRRELRMALGRRKGS